MHRQGSRGERRRSGEALQGPLRHLVAADRRVLLPSGARGLWVPELLQGLSGRDAVGSAKGAEDPMNATELCISPRGPSSEATVDAHARTAKTLAALALRYGRELAVTRNRKFTELFDLSLEGELARRAVVLRIHRELPRLSIKRIDAAVERELEPTPP